MFLAKRKASLMFVILNPMTHKDFALRLARRAGDIMRKNFTLGMKKEWKEDDTPITATDLAINTLVDEAVRKEFPGYSLISEEGSNMIKGSEYTWVCDPVDGTIPFSHGIPTAVFSLALTRNGESVLGLIYDPFLDRVFLAEKSKGAFMNGVKLGVSGTKILKNSLVCVTVWEDSPYNLLSLHDILLQKGMKTLMLKATLYTGTLVASGDLVANIFPGKYPWDSAALKVIVEEAGGKATDLFGEEQRYDREVRGQLATNGVLHDELLQLIKSAVL